MVTVTVTGSHTDGDSEVTGRHTECDSDGDTESHWW